MNINGLMLYFTTLELWEASSAQSVSDYPQLQMLVRSRLTVSNMLYTTENKELPG